MDGVTPQSVISVDDEEIPGMHTKNVMLDQKVMIDQQFYRKRPAVVRPTIH